MSPRTLGIVLIALALPATVWLLRRSLAAKRPHDVGYSVAATLCALLVAIGLWGALRG